MNQKILDFIAKERVCVLSICRPEGTCDAAAMHFSHSSDPFVIYIQTENTSRKCRNLPASASIVIGFNEENMTTLQLEGQIKIISDPSQLPAIHQIHYTKHPHAEQYKSDPATIFMVFTPSWVRYTDYKTHPPTIL
ncbi:MAG: hypothetical protein G01um101416_135 [Microgenomates group bacterium Gr01-1014_16]|nr:MAG: hypothetical protein G01um101416_135 [Microgenomates group bacterium Gr01-1014_16]